MALVIPDEADAVFGPQSAADRVDVDAMVAALGGTGVVTGCAVTSLATPGMAVAVAAGTVALSNSTVAVGGSVSLTVATAGSADRKDIVVANNSGVVSIVQGIPGAAVNGILPANGRDPVKPAIPTGCVLLAEVYVTAATTAVGATQILDKRCVVTNLVGDFQPLDPDLTALAGLDSTQLGVPASDGAGWIRKSYAALKTALALVKADVGLGNVDNTSDVNKPVSTAQAAADAATLASANTHADSGDALLIPLAQKAAAGGVATLDGGGKIPTSQLPPLAINDVFTVASQAAMLALTAQRGDAAVRTDLSPVETFILAADDPTILGNWVQITTPGAVTSVFGRTGAVVLTKADVTGTGLAAADVGADVAGAAATAQTNADLFGHAMAMTFGG